MWGKHESLLPFLRCKSKSGPRIGVRQSFQPASVRWFYCTHFHPKTQGQSSLILDRHTKAPSLGKGPPAGRGIGRLMNKQLVSSYGTDYSKEASKSQRLHARVSLTCIEFCLLDRLPSPPSIYMKLYSSSENTLIELYNHIEKYLMKLYNEMKALGKR